MKEPWWSRALCRQHDPDVWFNFPSAAKQICAVCPVAHECLEEALALPQFQDNHGIRAGLDATARKRLRQRRRINNTVVH